MTTNYTCIVTHGGRAHRDDFVSCCIALAKYPAIRSISRREPTPEELEDPEVLVLDVGGQLNPEKGNFDHHQFGREEGPLCALTLFLAAEGLLEHFRMFSWVTATEIADSKGPNALADYLGCSTEAIFKNMSPIEGALLDMFGELSCIPCGPVVEHDQRIEPLIERLMRVLGERLLQRVVDFVSRTTWFREHARIVYNKDTEVPIMVIETKDNTGIQKFRDARHPEVAVCVSYDDRGEGWCLYRFNDDPRVDFAQIANDSRVSFAHKGGFIAKTCTRLPLEEVYDLIKVAVKH